jgi:hypothetical protein
MSARFEILRHDHAVHRTLRDKAAHHRLLLRDDCFVATRKSPTRFLQLFAERRSCSSGERQAIFGPKMTIEISTNKYAPRRVLVESCNWAVGLGDPDFPLCMRRAAQQNGDQRDACLRRSRVCVSPPFCEQRRLPAAKRRDADSGVAFFCLLFLAKQEK